MAHSVLLLTVARSRSESKVIFVSSEVDGRGSRQRDRRRDSRTTPRDICMSIGINFFETSNSGNFRFRVFFRRPHNALPVRSFMSSISSVPLSWDCPCSLYSVNLASTLDDGCSEFKTDLSRCQRCCQRIAVGSSRDSLAQVDRVTASHSLALRHSTHSETEAREAQAYQWRVILNIYIEEQSEEVALKAMLQRVYPNKAGVGWCVREKVLSMLSIVRLE